MNKEVKKVKPEKVKKEIAIVPEQPDKQVDFLIQKAIEGNVSVDNMQKLLEMRKDLRKEWAKSQFDKAMSDFQAECPIIKKKKKGYGYFYAPLETIVEQVKSTLQKHGFSYAIQTFTFPEKVKVVCTAKHIAGHSETSDMEVPIGSGTKMMSASQTVAASITFAKRYAFCNAFGILTGDEDNDTQTEKTGEDIETKVEKGLEKLQGAVNINALSFVFSSLPPDVKVRPEIVKLKDELKAKFTTTRA